MFSFECCIFIGILFVFSFGVNGTERYSKARIYQNAAQIIQPLDKLPLEFTIDQWNNIQPQSITLLGENLTVTSQKIVKKNISYNGTQVYIRSPISGNNTNKALIKATWVDRSQYLVKIEDESISDKVLYFTVSSQDIFYLDQPTELKIYVDFTYTTSSSEVFVSYLRTDLNWQRQYQLNMNHDTNDLIVIANIRNDGISAISIDQTELVDTKINLLTSYSQYRYYSRSGYLSNSDYSEYSTHRSTYSSDRTQHQDLPGISDHTIEQSFVIDRQSNYLLPIMYPKIKLERYVSIPKVFFMTSSTGRAEHFYRFISDQYLPEAK